MWIYTKNDTLINTDNVKKFYINHEYYKITYRGKKIENFFGIYADVLDGKNENITIFPTENNAIQELNNIFLALSKGDVSYRVNGDKVGS
ncbi:MAG: hypothetical protein LIO71_04560 [Ruminococcus sp.]|nr:hypothetical protein [Ruminococcus sp.]